MILDSIKEAIEQAGSVVIFAHENPDGDAVGSALAFYKFVKDMGKDVEVIIPNYPKVYEFLPFRDEAKTEGSKEKYDLSIALDCGDIKRLDDPQGLFQKADVMINIDHHTSNGMFGDLNYVDPVSPAVCQIVTKLFQYYKYPISVDVGTCLIAGIITDTGGFQYEGVTSETFMIASEFLELGVNIPAIYKDALNCISMKKFKARKLAQDRLEFLYDGQVAYTYMTKKDMEELQIVQADLEGIVENGRDVEGVEISIFLYETDKGFKGSLRSNKYVNVSDICLLFNGGGHIRAAGCTLTYPLEECKERLLTEAKRALKK